MEAKAIEAEVAPSKATQRKSAITSEADAIFGEKNAQFFKDNANAMQFLKEREKIRNGMDREADAIRDALEEDDKFFDALKEIQAEYEENGATSGTRVLLGKFVSKIPILRRYRNKFDKAKWEHILQVQINRYGEFQKDLEAKLGIGGTAEGETIPQYIEKVRQAYDATLDELKKRIEDLENLKKTFMDDKEAARQAAVIYMPTDRVQAILATNLDQLDVRGLEAEAMQYAPDAKTQRGISFRESLNDAMRKLRDGQSAIIKASTDITRYNSLLDFYRYEEDNWSGLKEAAERTYETISSTIEDRRMLVRASIEASVLDTVIAGAIKTNEQLREHTSTYLLYTANLAKATIQASRRQSTEIVDPQKLQAAQEIFNGLAKDREVRDTRVFTQASEIVTAGVDDKVRKTK